MNAKTRRTLIRLCKKYPREVCQQLLETPFWIRELSSETSYSRQSDDTRSRLSVSISPDGDSWVEIISKLNPDSFTFTHRFRNWIGGGQSRHTHFALQILALAIHLDNEERKQPRLPFHIAEDPNQLLLPFCDQTN